MDPRLTELRRQYQFPGQDAAPENQLYNTPVHLRHLILRNPGHPERDHRHYVVDTLFPQAVSGRTDTASVDEGTADLLYGLVRGLQPRICLETGTHKGRSARAIVAALRDNAEIKMMDPGYTAYLPTRGHLYTIDAEDHRIFETGAIPADAKDYVTHLIGFTPEVFGEAILKELQGIEFAFLDGDHTPEGLAAELEYLETHRAAECWVAVDNSRDGGWPLLRQYLHAYHKYPRISLGTCTGLDLIWMH